MMATAEQPRGRHAKPDDGRPLRSDAEHQHTDVASTGCPRCWPTSYARNHARHRADWSGQPS